MTTPITVLHSVPTWLPLTETWIYHQVAELQRQNVDAHVACQRLENPDQFPVSNIHCFSHEARWQQILDLGLRKLGFRRYLQHLVSIGRKIGALIVHSHFGHIGWANIGAVKKLGAKHVVTFYGLDVNQLPTQFPAWRQRYLELFESSDAILCEGPHMARCIIDLGCPAHKVHVQHLGVDISGITFQPRQWHPGDALRVMISASFREKKGIPYAIEALGILQRDYPVDLTIIGDAGSDVKSQFEKQRITDALHSSNLVSKTRLLGYQPMENLLREAYQHHIFLSPSVTASDGDTEGGAPVTLIEMAASGMPIVATRHCDIPEVVRHGITGLLAEERDSKKLACHMKWLVEHPDHWSDMLVAARRLMEHEYDRCMQGSRLTSIYQTLLI